MSKSNNVYEWSDKQRYEYVKHMIEVEGKSIEDIAKELGVQPLHIRQWTMYEEHKEQEKQWLEEKNVRDTKLTDFIKKYRIEKIIESLTPSCDNCIKREDCWESGEESKIKCLRRRAYQYWKLKYGHLFNINTVLEDKYKGWSDMIQDSFWYDTKKKLEELKENKNNDKVS